MKDIKEEIKGNIVKILKELGIESDEVALELTSDLSHGDLTSNIALRVSKQVGKSPYEVASLISQKYPEDINIEKVEVAAPGFLNFFYSNTYLETLVDLGEGAYVFDVEKGKEIVVEYTDPNPFKILHIGHLYTNMVGESFARLREASGASVSRAIYQGDVGLHVGKTLYGLLKLLEKEGKSFDDLEELSLVDRVKYLGDAYMLGFQEYDDLKTAQAQEEVNNLNYFIFSLFIPSLEKKEYFEKYKTLDIERMYYKGRDWCMEYFERIYKRTGTKFDYYFLESEMSDRGLKLVKENIGVFKEDDGSVIYEGDPKKGLHTRVFVNKFGLPTYEAKELALAFSKFEKKDFDESVIITADEQTSYFKVVLDAVLQLSPEIANSHQHFPHGMVKLPGAEKMSSRKGKIIEGEWLLDETRKIVEESMLSSGKWTKDQIGEVSDKIAVASVKYAFLKVSVGKDVIFDFEKSTSFDGDTGPYLLYVYARAMSLLASGSSFGKVGLQVLDPSVKELLRVLGKYPEVLLTSSLSYSPSSLCSYLFDLGQAFNTVYQNVRILDSENKGALLSVVSAVSKTMKHGLNVLGIDVVEKM